MANIGQIIAEITANTAGLRRAQQDASRQFGQIQNEADATAKAVKIAFAVAASAAVLMFVKALASAADGANETKKAMMGLQSTSRAFGQNFDDAAKSVKELYSDGIMPLDKSIRGFKNLLSVGFNVDEAMQVSKAMKNIGAFNNVIEDLGQAFEDSTKGLKTNSMELIENIGLTQRISAVLKAANVDFSDGIDLTNNAAQRRAVYNAILAEGMKFEGDAAKLANDNASANVKLSAAWKEMSDNLGNRVAPAFASVLGLATGLTEAISSVFSKDKVDEANDYAKAINKQKTDFEMLSGIYAELSKKTNKTAEELKVYRGVIEELKKLYPEYLDNIDMEKGKYEDVAKALDDVNKKLALKAVYARKEQELAKLNEKIASKEIKIRETQMETESQIAYAKQTNKNATNVAVFSTPKTKIGLMSYVPVPTSIPFDDYRKKQQGYIDEYKKDIIGYRNEIDTINKKYAPILGGYDAKAEDKSKEDAAAKAAKDKAAKEAAAKKKAEEEAAAKAAREKVAKEWKPDTSKTLEQKKKELEYNLKADLVNAKEEEKYLIYLKYNQAVKVAEAEDKYAKAIASAKTQKAAKDAMDTLIKSVGESEVELNVGIKLQEDKINKGLSDWLKIKGEIYGTTLGDTISEETQKAIDNYKEKKIADKQLGRKYQTMYLGDQSKAVGLTNPEQYMTTYAQQGGTIQTQEELDKAINATISSFAALANELDNNFMKALANIAESAMSMKNSYGTFKTGQAEGGLLGGLGMLSGGIGMFTSAVSIFQSVGGLFSKSTYNFDEAVEKMLKGIGEKAPNVQIAQFNATQSLSELDKTKTGKTAGKVIWSSGNTEENKQLINETEKYLQQAFTVQQVLSENGKNSLDYYKDKSGKIIATISTSIASGEKMITYYNGAAELIANLDKIVPQLAEQLGTAAEDFGSDIASALSNSSTFTAFSENLEDNVFSSVKSGLISAFIASDAMKNLLNPLQKSITIAVADDYKISDSEMNDIKAQMEGIENIAKPFYDALEAVGLNLVDASDSLASESDRLSSTINRNLRLAERIQMTNTGSSQVINIDFTGANLGGVSEASMIGIMNRATAQSNIAKNGVR